MTPEATQLAEQSHLQAPNHPGALSLLGIAAYEQQQLAKAINYWQRALTVYPENSTAFKVISAYTEQAQSELSETTDDNAAVSPEQSLSLSLYPWILADSVVVQPYAIVFVYARVWQGAKFH